MKKVSALVLRYFCHISEIEIYTNTSIKCHIIRQDICLYVSESGKMFSNADAERRFSILGIKVLVSNHFEHVLENVINNCI